MEYVPEGYTYDIESDGDSDYQKVRIKEVSSVESAKVRTQVGYIYQYAHACTRTHMEAEAVCATNPPAMQTDEVQEKEQVRQQWLDIAGCIEQKISKLTDANWAELSTSLETFSRRQRNIVNASQLTTFFSTIGGAIPRVKRAGAMIGVQPTSKARRANTRSGGNRTLAYGRNAKAVQLLNQAKK